MGARGLLDSKTCQQNLLVGVAEFELTNPTPPMYKIGQVMYGF